MVGGAQLKPGDEVSFVLHTHTKTGELNAQRVKLTKEAPEGLPPPGKPGAPSWVGWSSVWGGLGPRVRWSEAPCRVG